jgi:uncharacterized protein
MHENLSKSDGGAGIRLEQIRGKREAILHLAAKFGIRKVRLFGSVVRGEANAHSDIDMLVDFEQGRSLLDQAGFEQELEVLLGRKVDVVVEGGISPYLEQRILQEAQPL